MRKKMLDTTNGIIDNHCHLDRAFTFREEFFAHEGGLNAYIDAPLAIKQVATGVLHKGPAYTNESLDARMREVVLAKVAAGEKVLYAVVDCSPDIDGRAFRAALKLREEFADRIDIRVGAYPIFGFKSFGSDRQTHLEELAASAQFLVGLPERDTRPGHTVGFDGHLSILIELAIKHRLKLQVHVDQTNHPNEDGTEQLVEAVRWLITSRVPVEKRPRVSAVHVISPTSYCEDRFWNLVRGLKRNDIRVISCPRAAASMLQIPSVQVPMHNSVARVPELLLAGIEVGFGTDNISDLFMPTPTSPLLAREAGEEFGIAQDLFRLYDETVYWKLMRGIPLNETDLGRVELNVKGKYAAAGWHGQRPWRNI
jgi:cytosine deaminase